MDHIVNMRNPLPPSRRPLEMASVWVLGVVIILPAILFFPSSAFPFLPAKSYLIALSAALGLALYALARLGRGNLILPPLALLGALWAPTLAHGLSALTSGAVMTYSIWGISFEVDSFGFTLALAVLGSLAALALRNGSHYRTVLRAFSAAGVLLLVGEVLVLLMGRFGGLAVPQSLSLAGSALDGAALLGLIIFGCLLVLRTQTLSARAIGFFWAALILALALLGIFDVSLVWILIALVALGFSVEAATGRRSSVSDPELEESAVAPETEAAHDGHTAHSMVAPFAVLAIALVFIFGGALGQALARTWNTDIVSVRPSWQATFSILLKTYSESPVFGIGPDRFGYQWNKFRDTSLNATPFWNVDFLSGVGDIPTAFVTTGFLGLLAWVVFLGLFAVTGVRTLVFRAPDDPFIRFVSQFAFVGASYLFIIAMFDLPGPVVLAIAYILAGLFISTLRYAQGEGQWGIVFAKTPRLSLGLVVALTLLLIGSATLIYPLIQRFSTQVDMAQATQALALGDYSKIQTLGQGSGAPELQYLVARAASAQLTNIINNPNPDPAVARQNFQATLTSGIQAALAATRAGATKYQYWVVLGNLYGSVVPFKVAGAYDGAKAAYEKAQALNPNNPQIPYLMAQLEIAQGNTKAAEDDLKKAIELKQDYTDAIILLSRLQITSGDIKGALAASEAAAYFTPSDPNVLFQLGILRAATGNVRGAALALEGAVAANPSFANARYFLAVVDTKLKDYQSAIAQIDALSALSTTNANALAGTRATLAEGKDPFPASILAATSTPVQ